MIRGRATDPFVVVSVNDDAIDRHSTEGRLGLARYREERDIAALVFLAGAKPTRFHCRPLSHHARIFVEGHEAASWRHVLAFHACVTRAENLELPTGQPWTPTRVPAGWSAGADMLADVSVAELGDAGLGAIVEEVGAVCLQRATLLPSQKKAFRLPPGFVAIVASDSSAETRATPITAAPESGGTSDAEPPRTT